MSCQWKSHEIQFLTQKYNCHQTCTWQFSNRHKYMTKKMISGDTFTDLAFNKTLKKTKHDAAFFRSWLGFQQISCALPQNLRTILQHSNINTAQRPISNKSLRPLTNTPEIGAINSTPGSGASFSCQFLTAFWAPRQSTTLEVMHWHEKLALEPGFKFRPMVPISGACVRGLILQIYWYQNFNSPRLLLLYLMAFS